MATFDVYDKNKNVSGSIELDDSVFDAKVNDYFLHQVLVSYQANKRQGTAGSKTRNTVRGGGSKPFRQKGTGRARQGTTRAPHHRGGARQFGPSLRDYTQRITKKMKQEAFRQILSLKADRSRCVILSDLDFEEIKTKDAAQILDAFEVEGRALFVDKAPGDNALLSIRNLKDASVKCVNSCSPLDLFEPDYLFLTKEAVETLQERYKKTGGE